MQNIDYDLRSVQEVRDMTRLGKIATEQVSTYNVEQIDKIIRNMVRVAEKHALELAKMAVEETGFGKAEDKAYKNYLASVKLYDSIKDMKTIGYVNEDVNNGIIEIAEPVGLLMGIIPSTNPTSTVIFKSIIAMKSRNAIIFSPHPSAAKCTKRAADLMYEAAVEAGAPANIIGCISMPTMDATNELMYSNAVKMIIATGGPGMVKASYSAGKPALGVGAGNSPAYIERSANVQKAIKNIIASKTFDNGTVCASEQSIICEECNRDNVIQELKSQGGYFMTKDETDKVCKLLFKNGHAMNAKFVGRDPQTIAAGAGFSIPEGTKVLVGEQFGVGDGNPLSYEKLTTVLGFYTVRDWHEACELSIKLLQNGIGHTMSLHTEDKNIVREFSVKPASRILVNTGSTQGGVGATTGLIPSFTLGCGTWGGSSVSENVTPMHLINIKRVAYGIVDCDSLVADDPAFKAILNSGTGGFGGSNTYVQPSIPAPSTLAQSQPPSTVKVGGEPTQGSVRNEQFALSPDQIAAGKKVAEKSAMIGYSAGCESCSSGTAPTPSQKALDEAERINEADKGFNAQELQAMVDSLVSAMKGE